MSKYMGLNLFKHAIEQAGHAVYITDRDGNIIYVNKAFEDITGYTKDEAIGENPSILNSGKQSPEYYQRLWNTLLSGSTWSEDIINKRKNGGLYYASQTIAPIKQNKKITYFMAIQTNTTERAIEQQQTYVLYRLLRHNLRNEINVISLNIQDIQESLKERKERIAMQKTKDSIDRTIKKAENIKERLNDVKHIENIDDIKKSISELNNLAEKTQKAKKIISVENRQIRKIDIQSQIEEIKKDILERYPEAKINIDINIKNPIHIYSPIRFALEELIENGVEHNNGDKPIVDIEINEKNKEIIILISDNGIGIPKEEIDVLESGTETPQQHSSGLGLWIAYWTVEINNGKISINNNKKNGTKVEIKLAKQK